jgi:hypothetical protein
MAEARETIAALEQEAPNGARWVANDIVSRNSIVGQKRDILAPSLFEEKITARIYDQLCFVFV